jgi:hypothetical protein
MMLNQNHSPVNDEENEITDEGDLRKYFTQIPNILFTLGLSPYALTLYAYFKKVAGASASGACWQKTSTIATATGMSGGMVSKAKAELSQPRLELKGKPLIMIAERLNKHGGKPGHIIRLADIWPENFAMFAKPISQAAEPISPHEIDRSQSEIAISPHEIKKNLRKEKHQEETHTQPQVPPAHVCVTDIPPFEAYLGYGRSQPSIHSPESWAAVHFNERDEPSAFLVREWLAKQSPEAVEQARSAPTENLMPFGQASDYVRSFIHAGHDPLQAIDYVDVTDEVRQRLIAKFAPQFITGAQIAQTDTRAASAA